MIWSPDWIFIKCYFVQQKSPICVYPMRPELMHFYYHGPPQQCSTQATHKYLRKGFSSWIHVFTNFHKTAWLSNQHTNHLKCQTPASSNTLILLISLSGSPHWFPITSTGFPFFPLFFWNYASPHFLVGNVRIIMPSQQHWGLEEPWHTLTHHVQVLPSMQTTVTQQEG